MARAINQGSEAIVVKTILAVDDSKTILSMVTQTLENAGYVTLQAEDGIFGLEALEGNCPDLIITDINMPRLDGFGFIERIRRSERFRAIPILVLTTESDPHKKERARKAGATGWIVKPFDAAKLVDAVGRLSG
jgi:two-component system, chemotaxis family, chemotaxis protein CheY